MTAVVRVPSGFEHPSPWAVDTDFDAFVLSGSLVVGDDELDGYCYTFRPARYPCGPVATAAGAVLLVMTYGEPRPCAPDPGELADPRVVPRRPLSEVPVRQPLTDKVGLGLVSQTLRIEDSGERVFVTSVQSGGFSDARIEWHPCIEEIYTLEGEGSMDHPDDTMVMRAGCYCFRPAGIPHGPFHTISLPKLALIRVDRTLVNNYCSLAEAREMWRAFPDLDPQVGAYRASGRRVGLTTEAGYRADVPVGAAAPRRDRRDPCIDRRKAEALGVDDDAGEVRPKARRRRETESVARAEMSGRHPAGPVEHIRVDAHHVALGEEPVGAGQRTPAGAGSGATQLGAMQIRDHPSLRHQPSAQRPGRARAEPTWPSQMCPGTRSAPQRSLARSDESASETDAPSSAGSTSSSSVSTSSSPRPVPGAMRPSSRSNSYPGACCTGTIFATGRPRSVTATTSPARTRASQAFASRLQLTDADRRHVRHGGTSSCDVPVVADLADSGGPIG